jgi:hypothetical protein
MRILDYYDIKRNRVNKKAIMNGLWSDIEYLAEAQFSHDEFSKFMIRIRLEKI